MCVLLDLDETLVDRSGAFAQWAEAFVDEHGLGADGLAWLATTDRAKRKRADFFEAVALRWPELGAAQDLWDQYAILIPTLVQAHEGVHEALARLRAAGHRLIVVTNGRVDNQEGKLRRTGLADLVDACVISEAVGFRKPDRMIFDLARQVADCEDPARCWVVGDDPDLDVRPSVALGLQSVWVSHGRGWTHTDFAPDHIAATTASALALI